MQGGIGEVQVLGIVNVLVEEQDYTEARGIVEVWDAEQPKIENAQSASAPQQKSCFGTVLVA